jgi:hypothetical protein
MTPTTRKGFFTALAAALTAALAKAQTTIITPCRPKLVWEGQVPLCNGQCPQPDCGYRAPAFYSKDYSWSPQQSGIDYPDSAARRAEWDELTGAGEVRWLPYREANDGFIPKNRLNRCPRCNTAFWQDPEKE